MSLPCPHGARLFVRPPPRSQEGLRPGQKSLHLELTGLSLGGVAAACSPQLPSLPVLAFPRRLLFHRSIPPLPLLAQAMCYVHGGSLSSLPSLPPSIPLSRLAAWLPSILLLSSSFFWFPSFESPNSVCINSQFCLPLSSARSPGRPAGLSLCATAASRCVAAVGVGRCGVDAVRTGKIR